ncbi:MAG: hypothetical protein M1833_001038 [Piccolia ochrophora]|nr:MAG: hypothetical protein M1833_001038 [Piccolia ochrophora]
MEEEDDDFYAPSEPTVPSNSTAAKSEAGLNEASSVSNAATGDDAVMKEEDLEEGEEEEEVEESDSDIDIITERKDGTKPEPPAQPSRYSMIRNLPARTTSSDGTSKPSPLPKAEPAKKPTTPPKSGADYPAVRSSTIDVDAAPTYDAAGKSITEIDIDSDLKEHDKPWRVPGTDISDYFNYGFDEFTWTLYCLKQEKTRAQAQSDKKEFASGMMLGMDGNQPAMPGMPSAPANAAMSGMNMPQMPGMGDMPPEMQQMMAQMMAAGMNPSQMAQMDPSMFGMPPQASGQGTANNHNQAFVAGQPGFGPQGQNQQQMGFGYDPSMGGGDGGRGRQGNFGARGRGNNRRNW